MKTQRVNTTEHAHFDEDMNDLNLPITFSKDPQKELVQVINSEEINKSDLSYFIGVKMVIY